MSVLGSSFGVWMPLLHSATKGLGAGVNNAAKETETETEE